MSISRRDLISAAVPLTASLVCGRAGAASGPSGGVAALRAKLTGKLLVRADSGYDPARTGAGATPVDDRFPAIIVQPATPDDVARALDFGRTHGLDISVRSGGHDVFGASTTGSGIVIDLSGMSAVAVDPSARTARAGAGARAGMLNAAGGPHGLAPVLGTLGHVGLGGLTLGGGIGWLCGSHGAAVDHLLAVEMVTADGRLVRADARNNPDLFWALRGGGGNFGVATAFTYRMQPLAQVLGGTLVFKTDVGLFLRFLRGYLADSPDALDMVVVVPAHLRQTVTARVCWSGGLDTGERVIGALKAFSPPVVDTVKPLAYPTFVETGAPTSFERQYWRGGELDGLDDKAVEAISALLDRGGPEGCGIGIMHYMHGALCRAPAGSTPFIRQPGHILYNLAAAWNGNVRPQDKVQWVLDAAQQLSGVRSKQTYINYLSVDGAEAVRDAYGPHYAQLSAIKRKYDPHNVFHNNRNIKA